MPRLTPGPPRFVRRSIRWMRMLPPLVQDTALALVLTATLVFDLTTHDVPATSPVHAPDALGYALVALLVLPLAVRRRWPLIVFAVILVDAIAVVALLYRPTSFGFGLIVALYTVARWRDPQISFAAMLVAQTFGIYVKMRAIALGLDVAWFNWPIDAVYFGGAWFLGYSIRVQDEYASALERSREALAERAVDDERTRIARELHDAVGHSVSVMLLHAGAAEGAIDTNPERAKQALESVGVVGRSALSEMDHFLGLLREGDAASTPLLRPSLSNLDALVEEFRELGLEVESTVRGDPAPLPTTLDQSTFRIVQEALTNTLKHAGPTRAEVDIEINGEEVAVSVRDHGERDAGRQRMLSTPHSQGIVGMRERAALLDGELSVGPCDGDGFRVDARLPIPRTASR